MALDQIVFQQQGVHFRRGDRDLDVPDSCHQRHGLGREPAGAEIAADPRFQVAGLAHIQQLGVGTVHLVNARTRGELFQEALGIEISHRATP